MAQEVHSTSETNPSWNQVLRAAAFRIACFVIMTIAAVINESFPGRQLADPLLQAIPYVPWVERWNYWLWLLAWIPGTIALCFVDRARFVRLLIGGGVSSLLRGLCIVVTCLGPVRGPDLNAERAWDLDLYLQVVLQIVDPFAVFFEHSAHVWLTKDPFFSGHTESTLLLVLYSWRYPLLRNVGLVLHVLVVVSLFFGHIHYTIDVVGGWIVALAVFAFTEWACARRDSRALGDRQMLPVESR